jgi:hypothetical protein
VPSVSVVSRREEGAGASENNCQGAGDGTGSPHCAGCFKVEPGLPIRPPTSAEYYQAWLERLEVKGRVQ